MTFSPTDLGKGKKGHQPLITGHTVGGGERSANRKYLAKAFGNMYNSGLGYSPVLYNKNILKLNKVPVFAAVYENDMYVDRNYSLKTAGNIGNIKIWETNKYEHNGLRSDGEYILNKLFNM